MGREMEKSITPTERLKKGTFLIKIEYSQKGTCQGKVTWAEAGKPKRFRSGLELIRLMDEALNSHNLISEEKVSNG